VHLLVKNLSLKGKTIAYRDRSSNEPLSSITVGDCEFCLIIP
jgi:hypothetical protein